MLVLFCVTMGMGLRKVVQVESLGCKQTAGPSKSVSSWKCIIEVSANNVRFHKNCGPPVINFGDLEFVRTIEHKHQVARSDIPISPPQSHYVMLC